MELLLALRLPSSDHAQELREALLHLTGHDISEHLNLTTLSLIQATVDNWLEFDNGLALLTEVVAGGIAKMLPRFSIPHPVYLEALQAIVTTLGKFYSDLQPFLDPLIRSLDGEHRVQAIRQPTHGRTFELSVIRVTS